MRASAGRGARGRFTGGRFRPVRGELGTSAGASRPRSGVLVRPPGVGQGAGVADVREGEACGARPAKRARGGGGSPARSSSRACRQTAYRRRAARQVPVGAKPPDGEAVALRWNGTSWSQESAPGRRRGRWERAASPGLVVRGFSTVPGTGDLWTERPEVCPPRGRQRPVPRRAAAPQCAMPSISSRAPCRSSATATEVPSVSGVSGPAHSWALRTVLPSGVKTQARRESSPRRSVVA